MIGPTDLLHPSPAPYIYMYIYIYGAGEGWRRSVGPIMWEMLFIYITRLASNEIFSPSNKIHREVGRAKDLSAPRYYCE